MRVFSGFEDAGNFINPVVTTGSFDGVHVGHKAIINRLKNLAGKCRGETVLITYNPHPRKVLYPDREGAGLKLITTIEERLFLLEKAGVDNVIVVNFTPELASTTCEEYVKNYLAGIIKVKKIVVGFNHYFGWHRQGDFHYLKELGKKYGFEAEEIPEKEIEHETVSSTRIRKALCEGYIQRANAYLDNFYMIMAKAEKTGDIIGTGYDYFRLMLKTDEDKIIPPPGIYAVSVESDRHKSKGMGVILRDDAGGEMVFFHPLEEIIIQDEKIHLFFHKRISDAPDSKSRELLKSSLVTAMRTIQDLIY